MGPETSKSERRREVRANLNAPLAILCTDGEGRETRLQAHIIDISVTGAKLRVPVRLPRSTTVYFYCDKYSVGGRGTVRYCNPHKQGYAVGLAFPGGTGWKDLQSADLLALAAKVSGVPAQVEIAGA